MNKLLFLLLAFMVAASAQAKQPSFKTLSGIALSYVSQIGCVEDGIKIDQKNVTKFSDKAAGIEDAFIVLVPGDISCAGGSGTAGLNLILLERSGGRDADMDPDYRSLSVNVQASEPVAYADGPRTITSIYQKNGQLFATGLDYGPNDSNCCPTLKTIYKIELKKRLMELSKDEFRTLYSWYFTKVKND